MEKRRNCSCGAIQFLLFSTVFCHLLLGLHVKTGTRLSLRDKRLFEISEVEITRVGCIFQEPPNPPSIFSIDRSKVVPLLQFFFVCSSVISCNICYVVVCSSSLLVLVPREGRASELLHILRIFPYTCI